MCYESKIAKFCIILTKIQVNFLSNSFIFNKIVLKNGIFTDIIIKEIYLGEICNEGIF